MVKVKQTIFKSPNMTSWHGSFDWLVRLAPVGVLIAYWLTFGFPSNEQTASGF